MLLSPEKLPRVAVLVLAVGCALVAAPLIGPIIVGAWIAHIVQPLVLRLSRGLGGRRRAAAAVTTVLLLATLALLAGAVVLLFSSVIELAPGLEDALTNGDIMAWLEAAAPADATGWLAIGTEYFGDALVAVITTIGASLHLVTQMLVLVTAIYGFVAYDAELRTWLGEAAPDAMPAARRLADAFYETGRGLLVGAGLTALAQGVVATAIFAAIGVPQYAVFGMLTGIASLLPVVGTMLVWAPLAAVLIANGRIQTGVLVVLGGAVVSVIDNLLRPAMSRYAQLRMSYPVLLVSTIAGAEALGTWGLLLGPLVVRVAVEAVDIVRERNRVVVP